MVMRAVVLSYACNRAMPAQVGSEGVRAACPVPFDEGRLWKGADGAELKAQLQAHFRNITAVMDCVGCEKCKLWGKLQLLGAPPVACCLATCRAVYLTPSDACCSDVCKRE
jgi:hypothetical protein